MEMSPERVIIIRELGNNICTPGNHICTARDPGDLLHNEGNQGAGEITPKN